MSRLVIKVKRYDQIKQYPQLAGSEFSDAMTVSVNKLLGDTMRGSPVDRGFFRQGWQAEVKAENPVSITGRVFNSAPHAVIIEGVDEAGNPTEFGRRPGTRFSPVEVMRLWVRRNLGVEGKEVPRVAYLVSRAIVRRGIKPKRPLTQAVEQNKAVIQRYFEEAANRLARKLEGKG